MPTTVKSAIDEYLFAKQGVITSRTHRWYTQKLKAFCIWSEEQGLYFENLSAPIIRQFLHSLTQTEEDQAKRSEYTRKGYAQVIKGWLTWCANEEAYEGLISSKISSRIEYPKVEKTIIVPFSVADVKALLAACDKEDTPVLRARARAIVYLLLDTGIRASELAFDSARPEEATGLRMADVHLLNPSDTFIRVMGKGRKERDISVGTKTRTFMRKYLTRYRGRSESPYVFLSRTGEPLTVRGLEELVKRLGENARVSDCFVHRFRHTFSALFKKKSKDIHALSEMLGHTSVKVTENYLQKFSNREQGFSVADDL